MKIIILVPVVLLFGEMTNPNEEDESNANARGRNTRKMSEPSECHHVSKGNTAVLEDAGARSLATPSPSGTSPLSEDSSSSVLGDTGEQCTRQSPELEISEFPDNCETASSNENAASIKAIAEGGEAGKLACVDRTLKTENTKNEESRNPDSESNLNVVDNDIKQSLASVENQRISEGDVNQDVTKNDLVSDRCNSSISAKVEDQKKLRNSEGNSQAKDDARNDRENATSKSTNSDLESKADKVKENGEVALNSVSRNAIEGRISRDSASETKPIIDIVKNDQTPVVETKHSTAMTTVKTPAESKSPTSEDKDKQTSSPVDNGEIEKTTPASKENGEIRGGTEFSRQVFGRVQRSISEDCRANGDAVSTLEKPKRIFQKPPEEYLPIVGEDEEDSDSIYGGLPTPPDGGWGWMVVFASFMIHVFADGFTYTLGIFYVHLLEHFQVGKAAAAWIVSILVGVTLGSGPISGALVNRFGCRSVTIGGALVASFMLFVSIYATNIVTLYFTIGLGAGLGFGLIYLPAIVCVTCYFEKRRSFATGIAVCGSGLGTFVFSPLVELLIRYYNWKGALIIISGLVLNCVFFGALFRPLEDNRPKRPRYSAQCSQEGTHPDDSFLPPRIQVTDGDLEVRSNMSNTSLGAQSTIPRRPHRHHATGSLAPESLDMQRIKSHGSLNPVLAHLRQMDALRMTASQPLFPKLEGGERSLSPSPSKMGSQSGLMARKDIFYRGSLLNIPEYKQSPAHYRESIMLRRDEIEEFSENNKMCGCFPCSREAKSAMNSLMDFGLLRDPIFQMFALSNFFTSIGFYAPYVFIVDRALEMDIEPNKTATLLAVVGISNTVSRVVLGYISDLPRINRLYLYNMALTICGLGTCCSIWMNNFSTQVFYAAVFGSTSGAYVGLTSVVLVDLLGIERLTNAFGLLLMFQGIASVIGPPFCGSLYEFSKNYDLTFLLAGFMIALSGVMLFAVPCLQRRIQRKEAEAEASRDCDDVRV